MPFPKRKIESEPSLDYLKNQLEKEIFQKTVLEKHLKTRNELLTLITAKKSRKEYLETVVKILQKNIGCRYVGIRILDEKGNVPYDSFVGFSKKFWELENRLSLKKDQCACTRTISQKPISSDKRNVTAYGSFNCPNIKHFVTSLSAKEQKKYRGTCVREKFLSLAIVPIRYRQKVLGAIHLADKSAGKISEFHLQILETMAPVIGEIVQKFNIEEDLKKNYDLQHVINSLLTLSLQNISLEKLLNKALRIIISMPWLSSNSTGTIFIAEDNEKALQMIGQKGIAKELKKVCHKVEFGKCLCGKAAESQKIIFANYRDKKHEITHEGMMPHGHYCVPIVFHKKTLGVLNIYTRHNHQKNIREETFLKAAANTLAGIIERKRTREKLKSSNRALKAISACNHVLIHATEEKELLKNICKIIVKIGGYQMAWVGGKGLDEKKSVFPLAEYGFSKGYLEKVNITWDKNCASGNGPTGMAIRTGKPVIGKNFEEDARLSLWKKEARKRNFKSSLSLPLKKNKNTFGALNIYSDNLDAFDQAELKLLQELSDDLAFGIKTLRLKENHQEAEKDRLTAEQKLLESYKYLGSINRQISILLDLNKNQGEKNEKEIVDYIINSAYNLSQAKAVGLYKYDRKKNILISLSPPENKAKEKRLSVQKYPLLEPLLEKCCRTQGTKEDKFIREIAPELKIKYFLLLPLGVDNSVKGVLFLGFSDREFVTTQELDFFEAFASQASFILQNLNILK